jgi:hypothetical protein
MRLKAKWIEKANHGADIAVTTIAMAVMATEMSMRLVQLA